MAFNLLLKWGGIKGWDGAHDEAMKLLQQWSELGVSMGAAMQHDTPQQKEIICQIIEVVDGEIQNDWSGEKMTKQEAKKYVLEYGT
jgi:hypothetical protein